MADQIKIIRDENSRTYAIAFIEGLDLSRAWEITVAPHKKKRSLSQNALMWKIFEIIGQETGNSKRDVEQFYNDEFLNGREITMGTETKLVRRSTADLNTTEESEFISKIYAHATGFLGIFLPHPDDRGRE